MNIKRTWFFWGIVFILPLALIVIAGICGNEIGIHFIDGESYHYLKGSFIHSLVASVSTSLIAAGIVYLFIDKKLRELLAHDEVITVILKTKEGNERKCPPMSRKDFSRAEVLGYIGMLGGPDRFSLSYTKSKDFGDRIFEIQQGKGNDQLVITCTEEELKQFKSGTQENDDITVILKSESGKEIKCPAIPRKDFSRAEVLGYIGMLSGAQRFEIASLKTPKFGENILKTSKSKGTQSFIVDCTDAEMEQFGAENENGSNA